MKRVNYLRSEVINATINLLDELEEGTGGDYDGFRSWGIKESDKLKGQLNSYRAQKIAQLLGKNISKQKLLKYRKPKDYIYTLSNQDLSQWLEDNQSPLLKYSTFNIGVMTSGQRSG